MKKKLSWIFLILGLIVAVTGTWLKLQNRQFDFLYAMIWIGNILFLGGLISLLIGKSKRSTS